MIKYIKYEEGKFLLIVRKELGKRLHK